ncbi:MAG: DNA topoisomerase 3, partial [Clostridia bacterium]
MSKLVIAEKSSVARSLAAILGATQKQNGYLEGNDYLVSWCVGHLVELAPADAYNKQYQKWRREDLPILPNPWQYMVSKATKQQFAVLKRLMNDSHVESIICATDAGREGELIFRLVYEQCGCTKPVQRLWISSMEETAIVEGFAALKPSRDYDALYQAALCRAHADWLLGVNFTRLYSTMYHQTLNIGRVMTPTLSMLVEREAKIKAFQPELFYNVQLDCGMLTVSGERLQSREEAEQLAAQCDGKEAKITCVKKREWQEKPPLLYDLTTLQREANRLLGYTAQQTLDYAQALYEKRLSTYPRTDSRYLTSHMSDGIPVFVNQAASALAFACNIDACHVQSLVADDKVSDHHAILPTALVSKEELANLPVGERSILTMLIVRLLCAVSKPCRMEETVVTAECEGIPFFTKGKSLLDEGWKAIEKAFTASQRTMGQNEDAVNVALPILNDSMTFLPVTASVKEGKTSQPKHYTEDTLLHAMETAGTQDMPKEAPKNVQEQADFAHKGIGTPATRAAILEKLVKIGLMERVASKKSSSLLPTEKGVSLITVVPEEIQSPLLTAEWEQKLKQVEQGELNPDTFMNEIKALVREVVDKAQPVWESHVLLPDERQNIG